MESGTHWLRNQLLKYIAVGAASAVGLVSIGVEIGKSTVEDRSLPAPAPVEQKDPNTLATEEAEQLLQTYDSLPAFYEIWRPELINKNTEDRLSVQGLAHKLYGLHFLSPDKVSDDKGNYYKELSDAPDKVSSLEIANRLVEPFGFRFELPTYKIPFDVNDPSKTINPIPNEALSVDDLKDWLITQVNNLQFTPIELAQLAQLRTVYLVNDFSSPYTAGYADIPGNGLYIGLNLILSGEDGQDRNVFFHELGHLIRARLIALGLINDDLLTALAVQPTELTGSDCITLANYDRIDAAKNNGEQTAALVARIMRSEPLKPEGRNGLGLSTAYLLDALKKAMPGVDIATYLMGMMKSTDWTMHDEQSKQIDATWQACEQQGASPTTTVGANAN